MGKEFGENEHRNPMVQVPLQEVMTQIAEATAEKTILKYAEAIDKKISERIKTHTLECQAAKDVVAFKNRLTGLLVGVFAAGGIGGSGAAAVLMKLWGN